MSIKRIPTTDKSHIAAYSKPDRTVWLEGHSCEIDDILPMWAISLTPVQATEIGLALIDSARDAVGAPVHVQLPAHCAVVTYDVPFSRWVARQHKGERGVTITDENTEQRIVVEAPSNWKDNWTWRSSPRQIIFTQKG